MIGPFRKSALLGATLLATAALLSGCESKEEKAARFAQSGYDYLEEGDLERADIQFNNALFQDGINVAALRGAADVAEQKENYVRQARMLVRLLAQVPDDVDANADFARISLLAGDPDDAREYAERALELDPENIKALTTLGAAQVLAGENDAAMQTLEQALALDPRNPEIFNLMAAEAIRRDNFDEALATVNEGIEKADNPETLLVVKLVLAERFNDRETVLQTFRELIEEAPENGLYRQRLADYILQRDRDYEQARALYLEALPYMEDQSQIVTRIVAIDQQLEGPEAAEATLRGFINDAPGDIERAFLLPTFLCELGEVGQCREAFLALAEREDVTEEQRLRALNGAVGVSMAMRDYSRAEEINDQVIELDERNPDALITKGQLLLTEEKIDEAVAQLREGLNEDPDNPEGRVYLALAYEQRGEVRLADSEFARAIDQTGYQKGLVDQYLQFLRRNGENQRALDLLERYVRENPGDASAVAQNAVVALADERWEDAQRAAMQLSQTRGYERQGQVILVRSLYGQGKDDELLPLTESILEGPDDPREVVVIRVAAQERTGNADEAIAELRARIASDQVVPDDYAVLGDLLRRQDRATEALTVAQNGIAAFPGDSSVHALNFFTNIDLGRRDAAIAALRQGIAQADNTVRLRGLLSNELITSGQTDDAVEVLRTLQADNALTPVTANNLASLLLEREGNEAEALEIARNLEGTDNPYFADTLAWAYYKAGQIQNAARYAEMAASELPQNADVLYHQGVIARELGDMAEAERALRQARSAHNDSAQTPLSAIDAALGSL